MRQSTLTEDDDGRTPINRNRVYINHNAWKPSIGVFQLVIVFTDEKRKDVLETFESIEEFEKKI